jgi:hypothetical protein
MKRYRSLLSALVLLMVGASAQVAAGDRVSDWAPPNGFVPNEATAIRIAVAVWEPIYGVVQIAEQKPYRARLEKGVWVVEGTLHSEVGGVAVAEIARSDGRVLRVSHGR